jgi:hypothetical protein
MNTPVLFCNYLKSNSRNGVAIQTRRAAGPLQEFWKGLFGDVELPIVMEDNASPHKKVYISVREELGMKCHQHPPNSPDLN